MDDDALLWLIVPFIIMVVYVVLVRIRPCALKLSRKSSYAVVIVVVALVIIYTMWNLFFR